MGRVILLAALIFLGGCSIQAGLSYHTEGWDSPEVQGMNNPLGVVRGSSAVTGGEIFCEHISSLPVWEQGLGFNHCGVLIRIK